MEEGTFYMWWEAQKKYDRIRIVQDFDDSRSVVTGDAARSRFFYYWNGSEKPHVMDSALFNAVMYDNRRFVITESEYQARKSTTNNG
ncbi:MAG: hypothetical protein RI911_466 [Candidatus Parcubacteria bacterium]|jgi:hypothetical protein